MIAFVYKVCKKISLLFERNYVKSKIKFKNSQAMKTCIIDDNVKILNPNVTLGENVHLYSNVIIWGDGDVEIGDGTKIGFNTIIYASKNAGVYIGHHTAIAANCYIIDANHSLSADRMINPADSAETIRIGNNVWLGACCVCAKGASLGDASVLGANSFLNSCVGEKKLAVGSPAKVIKNL
ncbi:acyltransferase [Enterococcus cecorum]